MAEMRVRNRADFRLNDTRAKADLFTFNWENMKGFC